MKKAERELGKAANPHSPRWKRLEKKRLAQALKERANVMDETSPKSRFEARRELAELRANPVYKDGIDELVDNYGEGTVLCLIQQEQVAWTRSIPAHPMVREEVIEKYRQSDKRTSKKK